VGGGDDGAGRTHTVVSDLLNLGDATALSFQFEREYAAFENADDVGNAGDGADPLEDRGLGGGAVPAQRDMESKHAWPCAPREKFDDSALNLNFGRAAASHGTTRIR
jgi:hypothetical protein